MARLNHQWLPAKGVEQKCTHCGAQRDTVGWTPSQQPVYRFLPPPNGRPRKWTTITPRCTGVRPAAAPAARAPATRGAP